MMRNRFCSRLLAAVAAAGLVAPTGYAQQQAPQMPVIADVALHPNGVLVGQVVNGQGAPQPRTVIRVRFEGQVVAQAVTSESGRFEVAGLRGGVHELALEHGRSAVRLWTASAAPPKAHSSVLLVSGPQTLRGQMPLENFLTADAVVAGGIIAGAIAIPVVLANTRDDKKSGS